MGQKLETTGKLVTAIASVVNPPLGLAGTLFFRVISYHSATKIEKLLNEIEIRLKHLESTGLLDLNQLLKKESFLDLLLTACVVAHNTQRKEKIQRIRNAVIKFASDEFPGEKVDSFFHLFDQLTEEHFIVLQFMHEHGKELHGVDTFREIFESFKNHCEGISEDAFGYYLYDLKHRRLIRLSDKVYDEDGLRQVSLLSSPDAGNGETVIVTKIALELLEKSK